MKKKEFKKLDPLNQYDILCQSAQNFVALSHKIDINRDKSISQTAEYNNLLSRYGTINLQKLNLLEVKQTLMLLRNKSDQLRRLQNQEIAWTNEMLKLEKKIKSFLIIFFDLKSLKKAGFSFGLSVNDDTIDFYPYKGESIAADTQHGHYGIVIDKKRIFIRKYAAYKDNGGERKKKGQDKHDVTETFNLGTFLEYMTLKSAK